MQLSGFCVLMCASVNIFQIRLSLNPKIWSKPQSNLTLLEVNLASTRAWFMAKSMQESWNVERSGINVCYSQLAIRTGCRFSERNERVREAVGRFGLLSSCRTHFMHFYILEQYLAMSFVLVVSSDYDLSCFTHLRASIIRWHKHTLMSCHIRLVWNGGERRYVNLHMHMRQRPPKALWKNGWAIY